MGPAVLRLPASGGQSRAGCKKRSRIALIQRRRELHGELKRNLNYFAGCVVGGLLLPPGVVLFPPGVVVVDAGVHVLETIFTDSTWRVGLAAVEPGAALAAPVADAELVWSRPVIST